MQILVLPTTTHLELRGRKSLMWAKVFGLSFFSKIKFVEKRDLVLESLKAEISK